MKNKYFLFITFCFVISLLFSACSDDEKEYSKYIYLPKKITVIESYEGNNNQYIYSHEFEYDEYHRIIRCMYPNGSFLEFGYEENGQLSTYGWGSEGSENEIFNFRYEKINENLGIGCWNYLYIFNQNNQCIRKTIYGWQYEDFYINLYEYDSFGRMIRNKVTDKSGYYYLSDGFYRYDSGKGMFRDVKDLYPTILWDFIDEDYIYMSFFLNNINNVIAISDDSEDFCNYTYRYNEAGYPISGLGVINNRFIGNYQQSLEIEYYKLKK